MVHSPLRQPELLADLRVRVYVEVPFSLNAAWIEPAMASVNALLRPALLCLRRALLSRICRSDVVTVEAHASLNFFAVAVAAPLTFAPPRRLKSRTIAAFVGVSMPVDPTVFGMIAKARERPQHRRFWCEEDKTVDGFEYSMFETKL